MVRYFIHFDKITRTGVKRHYYREFEKAYDAFEYMRKKAFDERIENVKGFAHHELDGVTYVAKLTL